MHQAFECEIPYEKQHTPRSCGAAALCMVYRSLGMDTSQADIWQRLARPGPRDIPRTHTWLLCADALCQGLHAVTFQARTPWDVLCRCNSDIRVILNHRLNSASQAGHYTVLMQADAEGATVHDPHYGPARHLTKDELLDLWDAAVFGCEVTGNVLVAIALTLPGTNNCAKCGCDTPATIPCYGCRKPIPIEPAGILGCIAADCAARAWKQIYCPHCDCASGGNGWLASLRRHV